MTPRNLSKSARSAAPRACSAPLACWEPCFCLAGVAQAQTTTAPANPTQPGAPPPTSTGLTWHGITLYGIVDIGLQYDTHAAPFSDYFMAGSADIVQKNSRRSVRVPHRTT